MIFTHTTHTSTANKVSTVTSYPPTISNEVEASREDDKPPMRWILDFDWSMPRRSPMERVNERVVESFAYIYIWRFRGVGLGGMCIVIEYPDFYLVRYLQ